MRSPRMVRNSVHLLQMSHAHRVHVSKICRRNYTECSQKKPDPKTEAPSSLPIPEQSVESIPFHFRYSFNTPIPSSKQILVCPLDITLHLRFSRRLLTVDIIVPLTQGAALTVERLRGFLTDSLARSEYGGMVWVSASRLALGEEVWWN